MLLEACIEADAGESEVSTLGGLRSRNERRESPELYLRPQGSQKRNDIGWGGGPSSPFRQDLLPNPRERRHSQGDSD